jgi:hypothetical protein
MDKRVDENGVNDMSTLELRETEPVREVGYIAEVSGNGVKAICNLKTLREMAMQEKVKLNIHLDKSVPYSKSR